MKITGLKVENHAGIVRAHLGLEEQMSVIVGGPASGKSSVLAALHTLLLYERNVRRMVSPTSAPRKMDVDVEEGTRAHASATELREVGRDRRALQRILGDSALSEMLLDPVRFIEAESWKRKRLVVGSAALDVTAVARRLRALQIPTHHGVVEAMTGDLPGALRRVRDARKAVEERVVRVSEPEDPLVETPGGTSRVSALPDVPALEAVLAPLVDRLTAMGTYEAATPGSDDPVAMCTRLVESLTATVAARQADQDALGWKPEDDTRYERRIPEFDLARGALAVAQERAQAAAASVAYLADLEDADGEGLPACPTCHHQPHEAQRPILLRFRAQAANDLSAANKAVWEAQQALKTLAAQNAALETRAAAFTVAETATGDARTALHAAQQALVSVTEHEAERAKVAAEVAALRERIGRGQALVALRRTYDAARATFQAAEASRISIEAEAQRYRDAEQILEAATEGRTDLELGDWISQMNAILATTSEPVFGAPPGAAQILTMDDDGELFVRQVPVRHASSSERFLAAIACGHGLAELSDKRFLVIDGLERAGYENVDRLLGWLSDVAVEYENLIVTVTPNGVFPSILAEARTHPVERPHVRYYHIDVPGLIEPVGRPEATA